MTVAEKHRIFPWSMGNRTIILNRADRYDYFYTFTVLPKTGTDESAGTGARACVQIYIIFKICQLKRPRWSCICVQFGIFDRTRSRKFFSFLTKNFKTLHVVDLNLKIIQRVINKYSLDKNIFLDLNCDNVSSLERPRKLALITLLTKKFSKLRLKSFGKMYSSDIMNPVSQRHKLSILQSNQ